MAQNIRSSHAARELKFLNILADEVEDNNIYPEETTFTDEIWNRICTEMNKDGGYVYTVEDLKVKAKVLKHRYEEFDTFRSFPGVNWVKKHNELLVSDSVRAAFKKKHPLSYYGNKNTVGEENFTLMQIVFDRGVQF